MGLKFFSPRLFVAGFGRNEPSMERRIVNAQGHNAREFEQEVARHAERVNPWLPAKNRRKTAERRVANEMDRRHGISEANGRRPPKPSRKEKKENKEKEKKKKASGGPVKSKGKKK